MIKNWVTDENNQLKLSIYLIQNAKQIQENQSYQYKVQDLIKKTRQQTTQFKSKRMKVIKLILISFYRETRDEINKFLTDNKTYAMNLISKKARELDEIMTDEEMAEILERAQNGREISREEFYNIINIKTF
ncbi:unnamed protein product [Paramecium sonneborni]|uniref:Uncharacterized protein n=1 Tax=Paramecium sonneborni TaxID=65129 RepID=A0A8S1NVW2_9CILI|nr:unnamed protein product [Paramecium sonneborni]